MISSWGILPFTDLDLQSPIFEKISDPRLFQTWYQSLNWQDYPHVPREWSSLKKFIIIKTWWKSDIQQNFAPSPAAGEILGGILVSPKIWLLLLTLKQWHLKSQVYLCKNLRISCLAFPFSSHVCANFTLSCLALFLISCPFSLRHRSIVCRSSIPTASRVPFATIPFLATGLRPPPVLTWKSSKATLRFSVRCAAATGWSAEMGQQILRKM